MKKKDFDNALEIISRLLQLATRFLYFGLAEDGMPYPSGGKIPVIENFALFVYFHSSLPPSQIFVFDFFALLEDNLN